MPKIIIVEDDPMISEIYEKKFTEAGFEVLTANAGDQVLTLAKKDGIDAILLDLIIPKMSGFDVIKALRSGDYNPNLKIVVFSNMGQSEDRQKALELGANGFLVKSEYTPNDLVKEISRLLNQYGEEERNEIKTNGSKNGSPKVPDGEKKKKILMMEDEAVFRDMFGEKLRQDGFLVDFAEDGAAGVKQAISGDYDLYIVDMVMPNITGDEVIAKLGLEEKTKNVPIVVLSASVDEKSQRGVEAMGVANFYIKTQIIPSELSRKVGELLG